jgi:hypothetical protein
VCRHNDHRNVELSLLQRLQKLDTVHLRHHHVGHHNVGVVGAVVEGVQHRDRIQKRFDLVAIPL